MNCVNYFLLLVADSKIVEEALSPGLDKYWKEPVNDGLNPTQMLINIMKGERFKKLLHDTSVVRIKLLETVADELSKMGAPVPCPTRKECGLRCYQKWRYLLRKYKAYKEQVEKTGDCSKPPNYFHEIDEVLTPDENVNSIPFVRIVDSEFSFSDSAMEQSQNQELIHETGTGTKFFSSFL